MKSRAMALAVLGALICAGTIGSAAIAKPNGNKHQSAKQKKAKKGKASVCHRRGNGSYKLIRVGSPAVRAHQRHGDASPGDQVQGGTLDDNCQVQPPPPSQRFTSPEIQFGPNGWAGWSCPSDQKAVGGGHTLADVAAEGVAEPGATIGGSTYPAFPHYTFAAGETGYVVQNDNDTESGTVFVDCVPK